MSDKDDHEDVARLERLNEDLRSSFKRCRTLVHDYEARLAANSNEALTPEESAEKISSPATNEPPETPN